MSARNSESSNKKKMNENAVQDIVSGFFQGALATKRTRHESAARLLSVLAG